MIIDQLLERAGPGLLVSVRSADEALAALAGGADVIDVKEPKRGPLGAADREIIADVVRVVNGRAPVTAAAGELTELLPNVAANSCPPLPEGVSLVKIGLAQCSKLNNWPSHWQQAIAALQNSGDTRHALPAAVIYADWQAAGAPGPQEIHRAARDIGCRVVLIDTWNKLAGTLLDLWPPDELRLFVDGLHSSGLPVVLAGSLSAANLLRAAELRPQLVAVRGAACEAGRNGTVSQHRVAELRQVLETAAMTARPHGASGSPRQKSVSVWHEEFS